VGRRYRKKNSHRITEVGPLSFTVVVFFTFLIRVHFGLIHGVTVFYISLLNTFFTGVHFGLILGVVVFL